MRATTDPVLAEGYRRAAAITRAHATTYYWGARLLPLEQRRHVHAVYALCRVADDVVDDEGATAPDMLDATAARLRALEDDFRRARGGSHPDPVMAAAAASADACAIEQECFDRFFSAMRADLTTTRYATWQDLLGYMDGSAAVIGEMMLPVLRPTDPLAAFEPARALGQAFQLTNFLRDIVEDLERGRVYVPQEDLVRHGIDLDRYVSTRQVDDRWRAFMAEQVTRNRALYSAADPGLDLLPGAAGRCVRTARDLYSGILDRIEASDHDVLTRRVRVPTRTKAALAARRAIPRRPAIRRSA